MLFPFSFLSAASGVEEGRVGEGVRVRVIVLTVVFLAVQRRAKAKGGWLKETRRLLFTPAPPFTFTHTHRVAPGTRLALLRTLAPALHPAALKGSARAWEVHL